MSSEASAARRELRAGSLRTRLEGPDLRYVRVGGLEAIRRIYVAVRDAGWNTIPGELAELDVREGEDGFAVTWSQRHRGGGIDFAWRGTIEARADATLVYVMEGEALADFDYNRIGICVLHPGDAAGSRYRTPVGEGELPREVGPQRSVEGKLQPLFPSYDELELEQGGLRLRFAFEGDLFEMEDQRNWTDASFKTYSTPLGLGFPHRAQAGQRFLQRVTVTVTGEPPAVPAAGAVRIELGEPLGRGLPAIGLAIAPGCERLTTREIDLLDRLGLDHLRVDLHLARPDRAGELDHAVAVAEALGAGLELAVFTADDPRAELTELAGMIADLRPPVRRALVFAEGALVTPHEVVRLARELLRVPCAGGTDVYFADVNRAPPDPDSLDAIVFSVNPQVHAFDDASLVENVAAQADAVASARVLVRGKPVVVSPVTLRPRFNPFAADEPPPAPDPRQTSPFAAAWTLGSVKYLAEVGADAVTYYEISGPRGILAHDDSAGVYPVYDVFARLAELKEGGVVATRSTDPLTVEALALRARDGLHVLVANMTAEPQRCVVGDRTLELEPYAIAEA